jgi:hypothetical protein
MYGTRGLALAYVLAMSALACGDGGQETTGPISEPVAIAAAIAAVSGEGQADTIGATLAEHLVVKVTDRSGVGVQNVEVRFDVTRGDASLLSPLTRTDADGLASATVTLGNRAQRVDVSAASGTLAGSPVLFTATVLPGAPAQLQVVSGDNQIRFPGTVLQHALLARAVDRAGNAEGAGIDVNWAVGEGRGSVSPLSETTDDAGAAATLLTLGPEVGTNTVEVTVGDAGPLTFSARAALAGPIAFSSDRARIDDTWNIFVMSEDGTDVIQLTVDPADEWDPAWSPDGTRIAFAREYGGRGGHWEIVIANVDGSGETRVTDTPVSQTNLFPAWSPDGQRIAFASIGVGGKGDVFLINPDGTGRVNITNNPEIDQDPTWSPDGSRIAFMSQRDGNSEIYIMNADGTEQTRLTDDSRGAYRPVWSPDGTKILFQRYDGNTCDGIWMMDADGTEPRELLPCAAIPSWSPDGTRFLASAVGVGEQMDVFAVDLQSGEMVNLTRSPAYDSWSAWRR